jgi:fluoride exporter
LPLNGILDFGADVRAIIIGRVRRTKKKGRAVGAMAPDILSASHPARYFGINFPWGRLIINVTGSFLIGLFIGLFATKWDLPQAVRVFLIAGICGGYTTFSTFSLDSFHLMERGGPELI